MQKQEISNIMIFFVTQDLEGQPRQLVLQDGLRLGWHCELARGRAVHRARADGLLRVPGNRPFLRALHRAAQSSS